MSELMAHAAVAGGAGGFAVPGLLPPASRAPAPRFVTDVVLELGLASEDAVKAGAEEVLVRTGVLDDEQLAHALAERYGLDRIDPGAFRVDGDAAALVDVATALRAEALPVGRSGEALLVAVADPAGPGLGVVAQATGREVVPVLAPASALRRLIEAAASRTPVAQAASVAVEAPAPPVAGAAPVAPARDDAAAAALERERAERAREREELEGSLGAARAELQRLRTELDRARTAASEAEAAVSAVRAGDGAADALGRELEDARAQLDAAARRAAAAEARAAAAEEIGRGADARAEAADVRVGA